MSLCNRRGTVNTHMASLWTTKAVARFNTLGRQEHASSSKTVFFSSWVSSLASLLSVSKLISSVNNGTLGSHSLFKRQLYWFKTIRLLWFNCRGGLNESTLVKQSKWDELALHLGHLKNDTMYKDLIIFTKQNLNPCKKKEIEIPPNKNQE